MRVHKVYAKDNAVWPFTVVGRPPQEDTAFGALIHEISGSAIPHEIPGVKEVHAVDAAGVHPLLLAVGSERYTPYLKNKRPAELLTQANRILGTGQLSLAKYLFISGDEEGQLDCHDIGKFLRYVFERIDFERDLHFYTRTTIDTLDYSGDGLNEGSKLVLAAYGEKIRELSAELPAVIKDFKMVKDAILFADGIIGLVLNDFTDQATAAKEIKELAALIQNSSQDFKGIAQVVVCNELVQGEKASLLRDYLWITYTRSNPSNDVYGVGETVRNKHWGCEGPMIVDARKKPHHAPELKIDGATATAIQRFFKKGASLEKWA